MRAKKAVTIRGFVIGAVILILVIIITMTITYKFLKVGSSLSKKQICLINAALSTYLKSPLTGSNFLKYNCRIEDIVIKYKDVNNPISKKKKEELISYVGYGFEPYNEEDFEGDKLVVYNTNAIIADKLEDCWYKVGSGKLDIFRDWWVIYGFEDEPIGPEWMDFITKYLPSRLGKSPTICAICARIRFDESLKKRFGNEEYSIDRYLMAHPAKGVKKPKISKYEYLHSEEDLKNKLIRPHYSYSFNEDYAIVYSKIKVLKGAKIVGKIFSTIGIINDEPRDIQVLSLIPYSDIVGECHYVVNLRFEDEDIK